MNRLHQAGATLGAAIVVASALAVRAADQAVPAAQGEAHIVLLTPESPSAVAAGKREFVIAAQGERLPAGRLQIDDVEGVRSGEVGDVVWTVDAGRIHGRLVRSGRVTGSFQGTVGVNGSSAGTFTAPDGSVVNWSWSADAVVTPASDAATPVPLAAGGAQ